MTRREKDFQMRLQPSMAHYGVRALPSNYNRTSYGCNRVAPGDSFILYFHTPELRQ